MQSILIRQAQIHSINHRLKDGRLSHSIVISGALDQNLAQELGCRELIFLNNGMPRQGFPQLPLDISCGPFRVTFEADPDLHQQFEITGDTCDRFLVKRNENGSLHLRLRLNFHGDPHGALAYVQAVGSGASLLSFTVLEQQALFQNDAVAEESPAEQADPNSVDCDSPRGIAEVDAVREIRLTERNVEIEKGKVREGSGKRLRRKAEVLG
jgi:hypothetical protein